MVNNEEKIYLGKILPSLNDSSKLIADYVSTKENFLIARLGETEQRVVEFGLDHKFPIHGIIKKRRIMQNECANLCEGAGFFPKDVNLIPRFVEKYLDAFEQVDVLALWGLKNEERFLGDYMKNAKLCQASALQPIGHEYNWTKHLYGKKVLVISPFAKTIEQQYLVREKIHNDKDILPAFELKTIRAVQSPKLTGEKGEYKDWFSALEWMHGETQKIDFDIALLGCGAYAFPLAAMIKKDGRSAITTCGSTQLLFGIMGKRWDNEDNRRDWGVNEYWVRPD